MAELSNKSLAIMLLALVVLSLGGSLVIINKMGQVSTTGFIASGTGLVNLSVEAVISIYMDDALIDFGQCSPVGGAVTNITSEKTENTTLVCPNFVAADNLTVRNDGNINVSVSMNTSKVGKQDNTTVPTANVFLNSSTGTSSIMYKSTSAGRAPNVGGCTAGTVGSYTTLYSPNLGYSLCSNLRTHDTINSFAVDFLIQIPQDAPVGAESTTLNFLAIASLTP